MTLYTPNRGYPYPSSPEECGNGALHSELLARAIDADLTTLDSAWAAALVSDSLITELKLADSSPMSSGSDTPQFTDTVTKRTGVRIANNAQNVEATEPGWYQVTAHTRAHPTGATTGSAKHQVSLRHYRDDPAGGGFLTLGVRYALTFQGNVGDVYNSVSGAFRMLAGDQVWMYYLHGNTASTVVLIGSGTFGTRLETIRLGGL